MSSVGRSGDLQSIRRPTPRMNSSDDDDDVKLTWENSDAGILSTLYNPFRYATILIQLGYEPLQPRLTHTTLSFIGLTDKVYMYPWKGAYVSFLQREIGLWNIMTTGAAAHWFKTVLSHMNSVTINSYVVRDEKNKDLVLSPSRQPRNCDQIMEEVSTSEFVLKLIQISIIKFWNVVLTQPFHVIAVRQMAAFIGRETHYRWLPWAVASIYRENGIRGYFHGLMPRLIGDLCMVVSYYTIIRIARRFIFSDCTNGTGLGLTLMRASTWLMTSQMTYPSNIVSTIMAVKDSSLKAADYCLYPSSLACWHALRSDHQLHRGLQITNRSHIQAVHKKLLPPSARFI